jgi:hypothetical protein
LNSVGITVSDLVIDSKGTVDTLDAFKIKGGEKRQVMRGAHVLRGDAGFAAPLKSARISSLARTRRQSAPRPTFFRKPGIVGHCSVFLVQGGVSFGSPVCSCSRLSSPWRNSRMTLTGFSPARRRPTSNSPGLPEIPLDSAACAAKMLFWSSTGATGDPTAYGNWSSCTACFRRTGRRRR